MMKLVDEAAQLRKLWGGFWPSRVLLTANNFRIFDQLATPRPAAEVAGLLQTDLRGTELLLNALTGLGLVRKTGSRFRNAPIAKRFLLTGSPHYMGDIIRHAEALWQNWSHLDEVVRSGRPSRHAHDHVSFIRGMHNIASMKARDVIHAIGLRGVKSALDLGGGPGTYSIEMARRGVAATLFDTPETIAIAREIVASSGVEGVSFLLGDFQKNDIGAGYDLIFISQVCHAYGEKENRDLIRTCRNALNPGGKIVIQEFYIDATLTTPRQSALFAINMLVNTDGGRCYAPEEMSAWLEEAGLRQVSTAMHDDSVIVTGRV